MEESVTEESAPELGFEGWAEGTLLFMLFSRSVLSDSLRPHGMQHCSTAGFPVLHCLPEFAQVHVH